MEAVHDAGEDHVPDNRIPEARELFLSIGDRRRKALAFYTLLSNIAAAVSAVLVPDFWETPFTILLRYLSICMLLMTFFVTSCILIPMGGDPKLLPVYL